MKAALLGLALGFVGATFVRMVRPAPGMTPEAHVFRLPTKVRDLNVN